MIYTSVKKNIEGDFMATLNTAILQLLVCPVSKCRLDFDENKQKLKSKSAGVCFPVQMGVPLLILSESEGVDDHERQSVGVLEPM